VSNLTHFSQSKAVSKVIELPKDDERGAAETLIREIEKGER